MKKKTIKAWAVGDEIGIFESVGADDFTTLAVFRLKSEADAFAKAFSNWERQIKVWQVALGSIKSKKKALTSKENGKKGGRPKNSEDKLGKKYV